MAMRLGGLIAVLAVLVIAGCGGGSGHSFGGGGGGTACTFQSSSSSGGFCRADYQCADGHRGVSCGEANGDCICLIGDNDTRGAKFTLAGFCASAPTAQQATFEQNCLAAAKDGGGGD